MPRLFDEFAASERNDFFVILLQAGIIEPLLAMLIGDGAGNRNTDATSAGGDAHSSALAMELVKVLAASPKLIGKLERAGVIPAVEAWLDPVHGANRGGVDATTRNSLMQNALIVLVNLVRASGESTGEFFLLCVDAAKERYQRASSVCGQGS